MACTSKAPLASSSIESEGSDADHDSIAIQMNEVVPPPAEVKDQEAESAERLVEEGGASSDSIEPDEEKKKDLAAPVPADDKSCLCLTTPTRRKVCKRVLQASACLGSVPLVLVFVVVPLLIYLFPNLMQHLFFLNFRRLPLTDYENVSSNNVKSIGRSFYLDGDEGKVGVWHTLPSSLSASYREKGIHPTDEEMEASIEKENYPVVVYAHGNSFDRTISHRCELYNVLNDMDYHVLAFDYRGYGDSEGSPTEDGLVNDTRLVYDYGRKRLGRNTIIVWGHSMGTGVSTHLVRLLSIEGRPPHGLVLEAAFNNLHDVVFNHPFSLPLRWMPDSMTDALIMKPLKTAGLVMDSDKRIKEITCPILIMHADDDHVIPAKLGRMLADSARSSDRDVEYVEFDAKRAFKHKFIYLAPELPAIVSKFVSRCSPSNNLSPVGGAKTINASRG